MDMETLRHGDGDMKTETWRHRDIETWKHGNMKKWRHEDTEKWRHGDMVMETCRHQTENRSLGNFP